MDIFGYLAALVMGISLGLIGGGGSILTVPILVYLFNQDPLIATTGSLFVVGSTALVGAILNAKTKLIDFRTGAFFAIPSLFGVFAARRFILPSIPDHIFSLGEFTFTKPLLVMIFFGIIMVLASRAMIRSGRKTSSPVAMDSVSSKAALIKIISHGFLIGVTTGFVGAGGGFLIIPALVLLLKLPMNMAVGTSLAIIATNSLLGFTISIGNSHLDWPLLIKISAIGIFGIVIGQLYSSRVNEKLLKRMFGYFVLLIGLFVLLDQIFKMS